MDVEAEYAEGDGAHEEPIDEDLDPVEDPLDDLIDMRGDSDEDPDEDPEEEPVPEEIEEDSMVDPIAAEDGGAEEEEGIDWEAELAHIDDFPEEDGLCAFELDDLQGDPELGEVPEDGPDEEEGDFEDPVWEFPEQDEEEAGEPEVIDPPVEVHQIFDDEEEEEEMVVPLEQAQQQIQAAREVAFQFADLLAMERHRSERLRTMLESAGLVADGLEVRYERLQQRSAEALRVLSSRVERYPGTSGHPSNSISKAIVADMIAEAARDMTSRR